MTDTAANPNSSVDDFVKRLKGASPRLQAKAKLVAAIGVVLHSKKPLEAKSDMIMALAESVMLDTELALLMKICEIHEHGKNIFPDMKMETVVATMGSKIADKSEKAQNLMKTLALMFEDETGPSIQL